MRNRVTRLWMMLLLVGVAASATASSKAPIIVSGTEWTVPVNTHLVCSSLGSWKGSDTYDIFFDDTDVFVDSAALETEFDDLYAANTKGKVVIDVIHDQYLAQIGAFLTALADQSQDTVDLTTLHLTKVGGSAQVSTNKKGDKIKYNLDIQFRVEAVVRGKAKTLKGIYQVAGTGDPVVVSAESSLP